MNRIVEAFTRSHCDVTAIDEFIQFVTIVAVIAIFALVTYLLLKLFLDR